jgi:glycosyltransferase involved in cell wall biosynthesis
VAIARTTVVVPCHDEAGRLPSEAFRAFAASHPDVGFVFVDDGSADATARVLQDLCDALDGRSRLLRLPRNVGKGEAVRAGLLQALEGGAAVVGYWDADLATPLEAIPEMSRVLERHPRCLMVFGSRVRLLGRDIERRAVRHYLGRVFATVVSQVLDLAVYDTQCGAKLLRDDPLVRQLLARPFRSRWVFDVEILARLRAAVGQATWARAGELVREHPLAAWRDVGASKVRAGDFVRAGLDLIGIWRHELRPTRR